MEGFVGNDEKFKAKMLRDWEPVEVLRDRGLCAVCVCVWASPTGCCDASSALDRGKVACLLPTCLLTSRWLALKQPRRKSTMGVPGDMGRTE